MKSPARYWIIAALAGCVMFLLGLFTLTTRRAVDPNLYLANKSIACAAFLLILLSYSFSAFYHFNKRFKRGLVMRRPFGIVGFGFAILHVGLTLFVQDPQQTGIRKFPFPSYFLDHWVAILLAILAFGYFTYALKISFFPGEANSDNLSLWRRRLRYGYVAALLVLIHVVLLKFQGWIDWFGKFDPSIPPLSLFAISIAFTLLFLKAKHLKGARRIF